MKVGLSDAERERWADDARHNRGSTLLANKRVLALLAAIDACEAQYDAEWEASMTEMFDLKMRAEKAEGVR